MYIYVASYTTTVCETDPEISLSLESHNELLFMFTWVVSPEGGGTVFIGEEKRGCVLEQLASNMRSPFEWNKNEDAAIGPLMEQ